MDFKTAFHLLFCSLAVAALSLLAMAAEAHAEKLITLYQFTGGTDGATPYGGVVQDAAGVLYGATGSGGNPACFEGCGTVYSFNRAGGLKTLVSFNGPDGYGPGHTLFLSGTTLYGNTSSGGASNDGVIFSVHTDGSGFTLLHQFSGPDGLYPTGTPQLGTDGTLYGIAPLGGSNNQGVLFAITPDGTYTILHEFTGGADGGSPTSLLMSPTGMLVGSTFQGGTNSVCGASTGCGVIFAYTPSSNKFSVLHTFTGNSSEPLLGSIGPGPTVFGTTINLNGNDVFALSPSGFTSVIELRVYNSGSQYPGPTLAPDGSLLLTDGPNSYGQEGNLLRIKNSKVVAGIEFNDTEGNGPAGQPIVSKTGTVIGTTIYGGLCGSCGTIYEVVP